MMEIPQAPPTPWPPTRWRTRPRRAASSANPWLRFTIRRLGQLLISALVLVTASFLIIHLIPGDPVRAALGFNASQQLVETRRAQLGLNDPLWLQYAHYLQNLFTGRFGTSISSGSSCLRGDRAAAPRHP